MKRGFTDAAGGLLPIALAVGCAFGNNGLGNVLLLSLVFQSFMLTLCLIILAGEKSKVPVPRYMAWKFFGYMLAITACVCAYTSSWLSAFLAGYISLLHFVIIEMVKDTLAKRAGKARA